MTLVLSGASGNDFVVMTSDSMRSTQRYYVDDLTLVAGSTKPSDTKAQKVFKLTDFVLIGAGGISELALDLFEKMQERVSPGYDLSDCHSALIDAISEMRAEDKYYSEFMGVEDKLKVILNGYYKDGSTGQITFDSGRDRDIKDIRTPADKFQYAMIPPAADFAAVAGQLLIPDEGTEYTIDNVVTHYVRTHATIHQLQPRQVSSDCRYHVLYRDGSTVHYTDGEIETKQ